MTETKLASWKGIKVYKGPLHKDHKERTTSIIRRIHIQTDDHTSNRKD